MPGTAKRGCLSDGTSRAIIAVCGMLWNCKFGMAVAIRRLVGCVEGSGVGI